MKRMSDLELDNPKLIIEMIDNLTVEARCNDCKSINIAVIMKRIPIEVKREEHENKESKYKSLYTCEYGDSGCDGYDDDVYACDKHSGVKR